MLSERPIEYGVIYGVMWMEHKANIGGHALIILIKKDQTEEFDVQRTFSFYPMRSDSKEVSWLKKRIKLSVDLSGNHGVFTPEKWHYIDYPYPMRAVRFKISKEKFEELNLRCDTRESEQAAAIAEHAKALNLSPLPIEAQHVYAYENNALRIFNQEKVKAAEAHSPLRLRPFELSSNSCKVEMLRILEGIITPEEHQSIQGGLRAIPMFYGNKISMMFFNGEGPVHSHDKSHYSRTQTDSRVSLMTCPQESDVITTITKLKRLEKLLENPEFKDNNECQNLLSSIRRHYICFDKQPTPPVRSSLSRLFSGKTTLEKDLKNAKNFLNTFYAAAIGEYDKEGIDKEDNADLPFFVVPDLPLSMKKEICNILGKKYMDASIKMDVSAEEEEEQSSQTRKLKAM